MSWSRRSAGSSKKSTERIDAREHTKAAFTGRLLLWHAVADCNRLPNGNRALALWNMCNAAEFVRELVGLLEAP
jgi:hypothetical protein